MKMEAKQNPDSPINEESEQAMETIPLPSVTVQTSYDSRPQVWD